MQKMCPLALGHKTEFRVRGTSEVTLFYACTPFHILPKWVFHSCLNISVDKGIHWLPHWNNFFLQIISSLLTFPFIGPRSGLWSQWKMPSLSHRMFFCFPVFTGKYPFRAPRWLLHLQHQALSWSQMKKNSKEEGRYLYKESKPIPEVSTGFPLRTH